MHILYIGNDIKHVTCGADLVNKRNISFLKKMSNDRLTFFPLLLESTFKDKILFYLGGLNKRLEKGILQHISNNTYDIVFISHSLLGRIASKIKKKNPSIKIVCCFHNIEKQYAKEYIRVSGMIHLPFLYAATYNENLAVKYSDYSILLNQRDSNLYTAIYKKKASLILPVSCEDKFEEHKCIIDIDSIEQITYLFVGVSFFANIEAISWFISNVLPFIPGRLIIAGKGMDNYRTKFESPRVTVEGYVKDLADLYYSSTYIILPIQSGGGMKTKTAEALMYGKTVIGTKEAFEGYRLVDGATYLCCDANDFINTIHSLIKARKAIPYNIKSRELFLTHYSYETNYHYFLSLFKNSI